MEALFHVSLEWCLSGGGMTLVLEWGTTCLYHIRKYCLLQQITSSHSGAEYL